MSKAPLPQVHTAHQLARSGYPAHSLSQSWFTLGAPADSLFQCDLKKTFSVDEGGVEPPASSL